MEEALTKAREQNDSVTSPTTTTRTTLMRIPDFLARVKAIPRKETKKIWSVCAAEMRHLKHGTYLSRKHGFAERHGYMRTTLRFAVTKYRNAIKEDADLGTAHPALEYLRVSQGDQTFVAMNQLARVYAQHKRLRPLLAEPLLALAQGVLAKPHRQPPLLVAASLLLVTGRRPVEVMLMGSFRVSKRPHHLWFSGQAKTRGSDNAQVAPYEIPVLDAPGRVLRAASWLREQVPLQGLTPNEAHKRYNVMLNRYAQQFRDGENTALTPSELRAAYGTIAYFRHAPKHVSVQAYLAQILGHSEGDLVTSHSYLRFFLNSPERRGQAGRAPMLRRIQEGTLDVIDRLEAEMAGARTPEARDLLARRILQFAETLRK